MYLFARKMLGFCFVCFVFFTNPRKFNVVRSTAQLRSSIPLTVKRLPISQPPEPMYTEGDVKALKEQHAEEIQLLQEEYE